MSDPRDLYDLLPAVHRLRDAEQNYPLRALLRALQRQADDLGKDTTRLYENWFIETCEDRFVPYFAQLVGLDLGPALPSAGDVGGAGADATWRRRQVAYAIADRRRKGSLAVLEQLAADATDWPARAVELARLVLSTQSARFADVGERRLIDVGDADALEVLNSPLSSAAPLLDVRRVSSHRTRGTASPTGVAVWLWRLVAESVRRAPAADRGDDSRYAFDQLGRDVGLAVSPSARAAGRRPAMDLDVPTPITRAALELRLEDYYGPARSICVYCGADPVPRSQIVVADLGGWRHRTPPGRVSIDPERGRIAFPSRQPPEGGVSVTCSRLAVGAIGGGHYERLVPDPEADVVPYVVGGGGAGSHASIGEALSAWAGDKRKHAKQRKALIEIADDGVYEERFDIELAGGEELEIRAAQGCRPILVPVETRSNRPDHVRVSGPDTDARVEAQEPGDYASSAPAGGYGAPPSAAPPATRRSHRSTRAPTLTLDGIWVAGHLELDGQLGTVTLSHCTLVPAVGLVHVDASLDARAPSLVVRAMPCAIAISSSVVGRIRVESPEVGVDPIPLSVEDSVLDASSLDDCAIEGADDRRAWALLTLKRVTVLGGAHVHELEVVEDSLITGALRCERRQTGSVRFSYLPHDSRTPRRTTCQPDDALAAVDHVAARRKLPNAERERLRAIEIARLVPDFDAVVFGEPAYARLASDAAAELTHGAQDEGELGAYHDLWQALRVADLRTRLSEFAPAGTDIDIRFAT
jgi:hypothetical protein